MTPQRRGNDDRRYISRGPGHHGPHHGRRGMSSEPTQPVPQWWQQPQGPKKDEGVQRDEGYRDAQEGLPGDAAVPDGAGIPGRADLHAQPGDPRVASPTRGASRRARPVPFRHSRRSRLVRGPVRSGSRPARRTSRIRTTRRPGLSGTSRGSDVSRQQGFPAAQGYQGPPARTRRRRRRWPWITLIVVVLVLVGADRAANAYAENQMASQIQSSLALSGKPTRDHPGVPVPDPAGRARPSTPSTSTRATRPRDRAASSTSPA